MAGGAGGLLAGPLARRPPVAMRDVLQWHERLPPIAAEPAAPQVELLAVASFQPAR